jgi:ferredoxin
MATVRIAVDPDVCRLHGQCVDRAPSVFRFGDAEVVEHEAQAQGEAAEAAVDAAFLCPVQALEVTEV